MQDPEQDATAPTKVLNPAPHIVELRLNHPERLNAVDELTFAALNHGLDRIEADATARVVLLTGEGRAFCAGANYKRHVTGERTLHQKREYLKILLDGCRRLHEFPLPLVAVIQGYGVGIGLEMALNCDFAVVADDAILGFPEIGIGTFVGGGMTAILPRLIGLARARRMVMLGERLTGREAAAVGLVTMSVAADELGAKALAFARRLADQAPAPLRLAKQQLNNDAELAMARVAEREAVLACMLTEDWSEGVRAFAEKRTPTYNGR